MATSWTIRRANESDLDAITCIAIDAFPHDPQWVYRYPHATEFPEDHLKYTRLRYGEWLEANMTPRCIIMVAECPSLEDPSVRKVVALSIWRVPDRGGGTEGDVCDKLKPAKPTASRRDASLPHMIAYRAASESAQEKHFDQRLGKNQLSLAQLATHPSYFKRGAGTKLLEWGFELARQEGWPITLFAAPLGYNLYHRLGFRQVVMVTVQVLGEEESLRFPGMLWEPNVTQRTKEP